MLRDKVIELFVKVDDFCKEIRPILEEKRIEDKKIGNRCRKTGFCQSEMISLMILFHSGQFTNLKSFYVHYALPHLKHLFPGLSFYLTKGNVDDRNLKHMLDMTKDIFGKLYGEKGYISKAMADILWGNGIQIVTKPRKNMKGMNLSQTDKRMLRKRAIIECVNDELKNICKIQHTRHRSVSNFLLNILGALAAYAFFPKKPSLNIQFEQQENQLFLAA